MTLRTLVFVALATACALATSTRMYSAATVPATWKLTSDQVDLSETLRLTIGLYRNNAQKMDSIFWDVSTPTHRRYGEHLDNEAMRRLISPGPDVLATVLQWIRSYGIEDVTVGRHEDSIKVVATLKQIEQLLGVHFRQYVHAASGRRLARAVDAVHVPTAISKLVEVIGGHSGFPANTRNGFKPRAEHVMSAQTNVTPAVLYTAYNVTEFPQTPAGQRTLQSFFQAQGQYTNQSDLSAFCETFLTDVPFKTNISAKCMISRVIGNNSDISPGQNLESSLDSQYILSTSALAETWTYSFLNMDFCGDLMHWAQDVFDLEPSGVFPHVISMSYGIQQAPNFCLGPDVQRLAEDVKKMGTMGISVMIASGDDGSGEYYAHGNYYNNGLLAPSFPASIPYCTAVGATTFVAGNSGEQMATTLFGSGGGFSYDYPIPPYQQSFIDDFFATSNASLLPPILSYNASGRGTPDIALLGEGYNVIDQLVDNAGIGGTSCSTPVFSGFVTLLNNIRLAKGKTLGFLNPLLYTNVGAFTDVTQGNNDVSSDGYGWYCTKGWDPVTGLGTPNIGKLMDVVRALA
jgi:tripeptidyl-peptidase I